MSIGSLLPVQFYELAFIATFVLLPVVSFRGDIENYFYGMIVLYLCSKIIKRRGNKELPAEDRAVVISGCDSGFGNLEAVKLDSLGYKVFAGCSDPESEAAQKLKKDCSDRLHILKLDVTSKESVKDAGQIVRENLGACCLWALINDVGIDSHGDIELCNIAMYERLMNVNCFGSIRLTQELLPLLRKSKGRVILMSSINAQYTWPSTSAFSVSKMALRCFGDCLRMEMAKFDVRVCMIEPGMFSMDSGVLTENNVSNHYKELVASWDTVSDEVKSTYPQNYVKFTTAAVVKFRQNFGSKSPDAVIDAITEAVTGSNPKCRYTVHGGPFKIDPVAVYGMVHNFLPEAISDWLLCKATGHNDTRLLQFSAEDTANGHAAGKTE